MYYQPDSLFVDRFCSIFLLFFLFFIFSFLFQLLHLVLYPFNLYASFLFFSFSCSCTFIHTILATPILTLTNNPLPFKQEVPCAGRILPFSSSARIVYTHDPIPSPQEKTNPHPLLALDCILLTNPSPRPSYTIPCPNTCGKEEEQDNFPYHHNQRTSTIPPFPHPLMISTEKKIEKKNNFAVGGDIVEGRPKNNLVRLLLCSYSQ